MSPLSASLLFLLLAIAIAMAARRLGEWLADRTQEEKVLLAVTAPPVPVGETWTNPFTGKAYRVTRHRPYRAYWGGVVHYGVEIS